MQVKVISSPMILGEGPHWDEKDKALLFIDHPGGTLNRIYTETEKHDVLHVSKSIDTKFQ